MTLPEPQFETYMSRRVPLRRQRWYWRLRSSNGKVVARSSEAYGTLADARRGAGDARAIAIRAQAPPVPVEAPD